MKQCKRCGKKKDESEFCPSGDDICIDCYVDIFETWAKLLEDNCSYNFLKKYKEEQ